MRSHLLDDAARSGIPEAAALINSRSVNANAKLTEAALNGFHAEFRFLREIGSHTGCYQFLGGSNRAVANSDVLH